MRNYLAFLAFLKTINSNSEQYCYSLKRDIFSIIQLNGKPSLFLTLHVKTNYQKNLVKILQKVKSNGIGISNEDLNLLIYYIDVSALINENIAKCLIYFYKLMCLLLSRYSLKKVSRILIIREILQCEIIVLCFEKFVTT